MLSLMVSPMSRYTPPKNGVLDPNRFVMVHGAIIERDVLGVVEKIQAYDPNLKVRFLDPDKADVFDAPYLITEMCPDGVERVACQVWELNDEVFHRLVDADTNRRRLQEEILTEMEKKNEAVRKETRRKEEEKNDAVRELVVDVLKSPKDTYTATHPISGKPLKFTSTPQSKD